MEMVAFNKMCHKKWIPIKNNEICRKFCKIGSRVLGVVPRVTTKDKDLGSDKLSVKKL